MEGEPTLAWRRSNTLAAVCLVLWLVTLLLPWWMATNRTAGAAPYTVSFGLMDHPTIDVRGDVVWITGALALIPIPLLFLRVAARSIQHEPSSWRRDVAIACAAMSLALASVVFWPIGLPFWGTQGFPGGNATADQEVTAMPALGWWLGVGVLGLLLLAWFRTRAAATEK